MYMYMSFIHVQCIILYMYMSFIHMYNVHVIHTHVQCTCHSYTCTMYMSFIHMYNVHVIHTCTCILVHVAYNVHVPLHCFCVSYIIVTTDNNYVCTLYNGCVHNVNFVCVCVCVCRYVFLEGQRTCSLQNFRVSTIGRWTTHFILNILETVRVVPQVTCTCM